MRHDGSNFTAIKRGTLMPRHGYALWIVGTRRPSAGKQEEPT